MNYQVNQLIRLDAEQIIALLVSAVLFGVALGLFIALLNDWI